MFTKPNPRQNFSELDQAITKWWKENHIFEKSIENRDKEANYIFYDGPPFMSGKFHYGHAISSLVKDIIPRYRTMKGDRIERLWGWDTHGLPIENKVEKELKLNGRKEILEHGLSNFIEKCYEWNRVGIEEWRWYIDKIGRWADLDNAYRTMDQEYMESVWWAFKTIWDKDLIYKGLRTSLYSTDSSTPVSDFEVSMDPDNYRDTEDIAIYTKFELASPENLVKTDKKVFMLAWTTTPWTIPSNFALAVNPEAAYVLVELEGEILVLAATLLENVLGEKEFKELKKVSATELEGLKYKQIYNFLEGGENDFKIYTSEDVTTEDGTGVLHVAPAFGEADFEMGQRFNLSFKSGIDDSGNLTIGPWKGVYLRDANKQIADDLESRGNLLKQETYIHRLPYYRYENPLIYKTEENYFVNVQRLKKQLIESNEEIYWAPEHFKEGRFQYILENAPDWSISRSRFWGTAMPIWESEEGDQIVVGSRDELMDYVNSSKDENRIQKVILKLDESDKAPDLDKFINSKDKDFIVTANQATLSEVRTKYLGETTEEAQVKLLEKDEKRDYYLINGKPLDLHRPYIDEIEFIVDGKQYKRIEYTLDVWMDSGSMPFAQFGYPKYRKKHFEENFPGDFIAEYTGQIRAWFYVLHLISNALFDKPSFKNVLVTGVMAGTDGRKMSKTYGNYPDPRETLESFGGDAIRLYFLSNKVIYGEDTSFSEEELKMQTRETLLPLWNIYSYFTTYANMHSWSPREELAYNERDVTDDSHPWAHIPFDDLENELDAWILVLLQKTILEVTEQLDRYNIPKATKAIKHLISETSKWYIRSNRQRFVDGDKRALDILYYVLIEILKLLAPFAPFISEHIYRELVAAHLENQKESIHLCDFPEVDTKFLEEYQIVDDEMKILRKIVEYGHTLRVENNLKVRQPLSALYIDSKNELIPETHGWMIELLKTELNVAEVTDRINLKETETLKIVEDSSEQIKVGLETELTEELRDEGALREITRHIQAARKKAGLKFGETASVSIAGDEKLVGLIQKNMSELEKSVTAKIEIVDSLKEAKEIQINEMSFGVEIS